MKDLKLDMHVSAASFIVVVSIVQLYYKRQESAPVTNNGVGVFRTIQILIPIN